MEEKQKLLKNMESRNLMILGMFILSTNNKECFYLWLLFQLFKNQNHLRISGVFTIEGLQHVDYINVNKIMNTWKNSKKKAAISRLSVGRVLYFISNQHL